MSGHGVASGEPKRRDQAAREGSGRCDRDLLAEDRADRELERVDAAGQAQAGRAGQVGERRIDRVGRGIEVEPAPDRGDDAPARRRQRRREFEADSGRIGNERRPAIQPAAGAERAGAHAAPDRAGRSTVSTPGIARWATKRSSAGMSYGGR